MSTSDNVKRSLPAPTDGIDPLLAETERWREVLAEGLARRNPALDERGLNLAVQRTIERLLFLRLWESRGAEPFGRLRGLLAGTGSYRRFCRLVRRIGERHPLPLFRSSNGKARSRAGRAGDSALSLKLDDQPLRQIIRRLYRPDDPETLVGLEGEILVRLYERFLGKTIRLVGRRAVLEEVPGAKRARGSYYTPTYVIDYLVQNALGTWLAGKSPDEVAGRTQRRKPYKRPRPLTLLDPACGSGPFLVRAYQYLLDWYRDAYLTEGPARSGGRICRARDGTWRLTLAERRRILLDHLYGIDVDPEAVKVAALSLLLKLLPTDDGRAGRRQRVAGPSALPDLAENIQCGDFLAVRDLDGNNTASRAEPEPRRRSTGLNGAEPFAKILGRGGFDVVLGNPPYGAQLKAAQRRAWSRRFAAGTGDTAALFMLRGRQATAPGGRNGLIVPKPFTYAANWKRVRHLLLDELVALVDAGRVWPEVKLEQVIYLLDRGQPSRRYRSVQRNGAQFVSLGPIAKSECDRFGFYLNGIWPSELTLAKKLLEPGEFLGDVCSNVRGGMLQQQVRPHACGRRVVGGRQIHRYGIHGQKGWLPDQQQVPAAARVRPGSILVQNIVAHAVRPVDHIKIIAAVADPPEANELVILDTVNQLTSQSPLSSEFLLGLLLSRLINWYVYRFIFAKAIRTMHFDGPVTDRIPIRAVELSRRSAKRTHDRLARLVAQTAGLWGLRRAAPPAQCAALDRQIRAREKQVNRCVYDLFGLTEEETQLIERATV